jgi:hypothetical protein
MSPRDLGTESMLEKRCFQVKAPRAISCVGTGCGMISEFVIGNYLTPRAKRRPLVDIG